MRITPEGDALAEKRCAAQSEVADRILSTLTPEEVESLNVLTEKIIHQCKDMGTITVGYPDGIPAQVDRLPLEAAVHDEKYHDYTPEEIDKLYARSEEHTSELQSH